MWYRTVARWQQYDYYANYTGVKLVDLLVAAGVDVGDPAFEGITVMAPTS